MRRNLLPEVEWIAGVHDFDGLLTHVSVFLLGSDESGYVLFDSGSHYHEAEIKSQVDEATADGTFLATIVSHHDLPHAGNVSGFEDEWPAMDVYCASVAKELVGLPNALECKADQEMEIGGRRFTFFDAPLADITDSLWAFDHGSGTLFTGDGFGSYHREGESELTSADFEDNVPRDRVFEYHREMFRWFELIDPEKVVDPIEAVFEEYDVSCIAPSHGTPIMGEDVDAYVERFLDVVADVVDSHDPTSRPDGLSDDQRAVIRAALAEPDASDEDVAEQVGVSPSFAGLVRREFGSRSLTSDSE